MVDRDTDPIQQTKQRTLSQNRALHLYFGQIADALNEAGFDMKRTLKHDVEIPWNAGTVKDWLWRPIQDAQLGKESTTELTTKEIDEIFDTLNRHLGNVTGVHISFPSIESLIREKQAEGK